MPKLKRGMLTINVLNPSPKKNLSETILPVTKERSNLSIMFLPETLLISVFLEKMGRIKLVKTDAKKNNLINAGNFSFLVKINIVTIKRSPIKADNEKVKNNPREIRRIPTKKNHDLFSLFVTIKRISIVPKNPARALGCGKVE